MLADIQIDNAAWSSATPERQREWQQIIAETLEQQPRDRDDDKVRLIVSRSFAGVIRLEVETLEGYPLREIALPLKALEPHLEEYADICEQLATLPEGISSSRLEALDMGKRVVHDQAAKTLMKYCGAVLPDQNTARSLFTLLISLHVDTEKMLKGVPSRLG